MSKSLITIKNCKIENSKTTLIENISWEMKEGENWLVIGPNGGGKADFLAGLSRRDRVKITPKAPTAGNVAATQEDGAPTQGDRSPTANDAGLYSKQFIDSTELGSLEVAARLIQEERENDESEYVEGGVDIGRTGRKFLAEVLTPGDVCAPTDVNTPSVADKLEGFPEVKLCGLENFLDTGLKYMSTGQIRRTLLARALLSGKKLLILSDPFAGLDAESRTILIDFFNNIAKKQSPKLILSMERWHEIPEGITNVLEIKDKAVSFSGTRQEYEKL